MPRSRDIGDKQPDGLQAYLQAAFPSDTVKALEQDGRSAIILLVTSHAVYGFAKCDVDPREDYEATYAAYKTRVVADKTLRDLEPAFVFCLPAEASGAEQFISSVETDVYFCRKFVIGLGDDIGASLASLPFMPLAPVDGAALRPASAQTFLRKAGMPAQLAMHLVIPHERAAKGILEDCLAGRHGEPTSLKGDSRRSMLEVVPSESDVFLERVIIRNVRAYRKEQEFKLGRSVTVLYGPNGFGKTSFFDALDFGVTGAIGRLPRRSDAHFRKTIQHLDSHGEDAYVILFCSRNGKRHKLVRRVAKSAMAQLDGVSVERKPVLSALTSASGQAADRVDNFISLFRATHLFSQEQQELTKNFREDCELSTIIVSRMLAVEDYVSAKAKADEVLYQFSEAIDNCDRDLATLAAEIDAETKQLEALRAAAQNVSSPSALLSQIADINARLQSEGLPVADGPSDVQALQTQRAELDGAIGQTRSSLQRLAALVEPLSELPRLLASQQALQVEVAAKQNEVNRGQVRIAEATQVVERKRQAFSAAEKGLALTRSAVESHVWFKASLRAYRDAEKSGSEAEIKLAAELAALEAAKVEAATLDERIRGLDNEMTPITELLELKQAQRERLELLLVILPAQKNKSERIKEIVGEEQRSQRELAQHNETLRGSQAELAAKRAREDSLSADIARISADQKRLVGLLDEIEGHIEDGICLVCGDDHGSREGLIKKIELRRSIDRSAELANALSECRASIKGLRDQITRAEAERARLTSQLRDLVQERSDLEVEVANFLTRSNEFAVDPMSEVGERSARTVLTRLTQELGELRTRLENAKRARGDAETARLVVGETIRNLQATLAQWRQAKASAAATVNRLRNDERWNDNLAREPDAKLESEADSRRANLNTATTALAVAKEGRDRAQAGLDDARRQLAGANTELTHLRAQLSTIGQQLVTLRANLSAAQLRDDTDSTALAAAINLHQAALARRETLRDALLNAELSLDAATTAASHVALQTAVREKEARKALIDKRKRSYQPWFAYFKEACRLLKAQQTETVGSFTSQYGPRTSVIQRRLRSVYSFDSVE